MSPEYLGIDTSKWLLEEMRKEEERKSESQTLLLEPLLALTGSLSLSQPDTVSNLHKCDIPTQLYLSGKLGIPEAILWLYGPCEQPHVDEDFETSIVTYENHHGFVGLDPKSIVQALGAIGRVD